MYCEACNSPAWIYGLSRYYSIIRERMIIMEKLYYSKGISKKALIANIISIALSVVIAITFFTLTEAKVDGPTQSVSIGGGAIQHISLEKYRYTESERESFLMIGFVFFIIAAAEAGLLACYCRSWTEIYSDSIKANSMGKVLSCKISEITDVSMAGNRIQISVPTGKMTLITTDPPMARKIIADLLLKR